MLGKIVGDIKSLNIQGATNIAFAGLVALRGVISDSRFKNRSALIRGLERARDLLSSARPNEPMLYNVVDYVISKVVESTGDFRADGLRAIDFVSDCVNNAKKRLAVNGKNFIKKGSTILTHCHASNVTEVLKAAKSNIKGVFCTETRPVYQGRITARELLSAGLKVTMSVDSAVVNYLKSVDYCLIGCDVISSTYVVNKVGSRALSILCNKYDVPFYVCALSYKFSPESVSGVNSDLELRSPDEVWAERPRRLKVFNPAFDVVDFENITGFITEKGVLPPQVLINTLKQRNSVFD